MDRATKNPNTICRTCLKVQKILLNMFEHFRNDKPISDILTECFTVTIQKDNRLPMNICNDCLDKLNSACDFREMVIESDIHLEDFYCNNIVSDEKPVSSLDNNVKEELAESTYDNNSQINIAEKINLVVENKSLEDDNCETICATGVKQELAEKQEVDVEDSFDTSNLSFNSYKSNFSANTDDQENVIDFCSSKKGKQKEVKQTKDKDDEDLLMKSPDISEYKHLRKTLNRNQKKKTNLLCKLCNKSFSFYYYFQVHIPQHTGHVPYKCAKCGKGFSSKFLLTKHERKYKEDRPYSCEVCGKTFKLLGGLQIHKRIHSDEYQYKCTLCPKMFKQCGSLQVHLQTHNGGKLYVCEKCGKSFPYQSSMYRHKLAHNTENNFTCSVCGKIFKTKIALSVHSKRHTKTYACSYCDNKFSSNTVLQHHISIHTGAKPYACKVCGKTFRQKGCIGRHMRTHTGETPYECEKCPAKFKYKHHLLKHVKQHE